MLSLVSLLPSPTKWDPRRPNWAYNRHRARVQRNYALFRGLKIPTDTLSNNGDQARLDSLSRRLTDERWRELRSGPVVVEPDTNADTSESGD